MNALKPVADWTNSTVRNEFVDLNETFLTFKAIVIRSACEGMENTNWKGRIDNPKK